MSEVSPEVAGGLAGLLLNGHVGEVIGTIAGANVVRASCLQARPSHY